MIQARVKHPELRNKVITAEEAVLYITLRNPPKGKPIPILNRLDKNDTSYISLDEEKVINTILKDDIRDSYLLESTAKGGTVSSIAPLVSNVDHTEQIMTEQVTVDLRGVSPRKRVLSIHPYYRDLLLNYLNEALKNKQHIPILLNRTFECFETLENNGTMVKDIRDIAYSK